MDAIIVTIKIEDEFFRPWLRPAVEQSLEKLGLNRNPINFSTYQGTYRSVFNLTFEIIRSMDDLDWHHNDELALFFPTTNLIHGKKVQKLSRHDFKIKGVKLFNLQLN